jgi:hypothetical protein
MGTPKRELIRQCIVAGGATKETILAAADCTLNSMRTNFATLRLMGFCAVVDDDGVYSFVSAEDWEALKAEKAANAGTKASTLTPSQRYDRAVKAMARCAKAAENSLKRSDENENDDLAEELELRAQMATISLQLAKITLDRNPKPEDYEDVKAAEAAAVAESVEEDTSDVEESEEDLV